MIDKKDLELKLLLRESHIQQLNLKVDNLSSTIDKLLKRNDDLKEYIKRLEENEEYLKKGFAELYKRIDDAIEYINERKDNNFVPYFNDKETNDLLDILEGEKNGKN